MNTENEFAGFLCGKCPYSKNNKTQGLAFNLLVCVTCDAGDAVLFALICKYKYTITYICCVKSDHYYTFVSCPSITIVCNSKNHISYCTCNSCNTGMRAYISGKARMPRVTANM